MHEQQAIHEIIILLQYFKCQRVLPNTCINIIEKHFKPSFTKSIKLFIDRRKIVKIVPYHIQHTINHICTKQFFNHKKYDKMYIC